MRIVFLLFLSSFLVGASCPDGGLSALNEHRQKADYNKIVFFASWCLSCKNHIIEGDKSTIYIAVFDEAQNAEKALSALKPDGVCIFDRNEEIAKHFGITSLPATRKLPASSLSGQPMP